MFNSENPFLVLQQNVKTRIEVSIFQFEITFVFVYIILIISSYNTDG
jgi:hypothetical protein